MHTRSYEVRRKDLTHYFDDSAASAWKALTSDAPVNWVRRTVRAGREQVKDCLLNWLPEDLNGVRILDAGCGTGALTAVAAARGADVVAVDVASNLVDVARKRIDDPATLSRIDFRVGDMCDESLGKFDYVVCMDSLIHYEPNDICGAIAGLAERTSKGVLFTVAPRTPLLAAMHTVGRLIPQKSTRAPAIVPIKPEKLAVALSESLPHWKLTQSHRVNSGFYISQAMELRAQ